MSRPNIGRVNYQKLAYISTRASLFKLGDQLSSVVDATTARNWVVTAAPSLRILADSANAAQMSDDPELTQFLDRVRGSIAGFATAEWIQLAPTLVDVIENFLTGLPPGTVVAQAISRPSSPHLLPPPSAPPATVPSGSPAPQSSAPSAPLTVLTHASSSVPLPPHSDPPSSVPMRVTRSNSKIVTPGRYVQESPSPSTITPQSPAISPSTDTIDPDHRAEVLRLGFAPREEGWVNCKRCKQMRIRCGPTRGDPTPFGPCLQCFKMMIRCDDPLFDSPVASTASGSAPSRSRSIRKSPEPSTATSPEPEHAPPSPRSTTASTSMSQSDYRLPQFPKAPLHGSTSVPLSDFMSWYAEFISAAREKAEAEVAKDLAISVRVAANNALVAARRMEELAERRLELATERFEHANNCYHTLEAALAVDQTQGEFGGSAPDRPDPPRQEGPGKAKGKGKGKAHTWSRGISQGKGKGWVPFTDDESGGDIFIWQSGEGDDDDDSVPMDQDSSGD